MPARSAMRLALAAAKPPSLISEIAALRIFSRVFFDFCACRPSGITASVTLSCSNSGPVPPRVSNDACARTLRMVERRRTTAQRRRRRNGAARESGEETMGTLDGKVAIVTGAGQGVGEGIAVALAKEGATLVVAGRTASKVERTAKTIQELGGKALAVGCDVCKPEVFVVFFVFLFLFFGC